MNRMSRALVAVTVLVGITAVAAGAVHFSPWSAAQKIDEIAGNHADLNTASMDGCPFQSPDGLSLYMASNRPDGKGGLDIWVATREKKSEPWGAPQNLPEPINSTSDDFCPTALHGGGLLFVSRRVETGVTCGLGDIYFARENPAHGWSEPRHLACAPEGPNSDLDEQGPSYVQGQLYFSRSALPAGNTGELYVSGKTGHMTFGPATVIAELNDAAANDIQPNVRKDGREIVFSSNRSGGAGGQDIWTATRDSVRAAWSAPVNLGPNINTGLSESRPSLSRDAEQLLFGRAGPAGTGEGGTGASDIYVATREKTNRDGH
jgi:WD40-like Beta Propeller Repeat